MKRLIAVILVLMFAVSASAELDFSEFSDSVLDLIIESAVKEKEARQHAAENPAPTEEPDDGAIILINSENVKLYLTGDYKLTTPSSSKYATGITFEAVLENNSDQPVGVSIKDASVNGWDISTSGISEIPAHKKKKDGLWFSLKGADIQFAPDIDDLEFCLTLSSNYKTFWESDIVSLSF